MATTQLATIQDLENIPDSACRHELIRGKIVEMPPAGGEHGAIGMRIGISLGVHIRDRNLGLLFNADTGFIIQHDPDTVLAPDVAFIFKHRLPPRDERKGFMPVVPDLVVEVISPSDRIARVMDKVSMYLNNGVQAVWLVFPDQRIVTIHTPDKIARTYDEEDMLDGGDVLPGFQLPVAEIFEE